MAGVIFLFLFNNYTFYFSIFLIDIIFKFILKFQCSCFWIFCLWYIILDNMHKSYIKFFLHTYLRFRIPPCLRPFTTRLPFPVLAHSAGPEYSSRAPLFLKLSNSTSLGSANSFFLITYGSPASVIPLSTKLAFLEAILEGNFSFFPIALNREYFAVFPSCN